MNEINAAKRLKEAAKEEAAAAKIIPSCSCRS